MRGAGEPSGAGDISAPPHPMVPKQSREYNADVCPPSPHLYVGVGPPLPARGPRHPGCAQFRVGGVTETPMAPQHGAPAPITITLHQVTWGVGPWVPQD